MWWDPFDEYFIEFERMHKDMDRMFARHFCQGHAIEDKSKKGKELAHRHPFRAAVADCYETENAVVACFELPGTSKDDIELNITNDFVEVKVQKKFEKEQEDKGTYSYESRSSQFFRRLPLPSNVDADKATASYKNGMLKVEVPKKEKAEKHKKRKIDIK